jgi:hypothetical protein
MIFTARRPLLLVALASLFLGCGPAPGEGDRAEAEQAREITQKSISEIGE